MALNVQDTLLSFLKRERVPVAIYLSKGVQIRGQIAAFDNFTILLMDGEGRLQMIYKQSITTLSPHRDIKDAYFKELFDRD